MTVKIFIGNLSEDAEADEIRVLFEKYGTVAECDVLKNYGFVHMVNKADADAAIANLNGTVVKGQRMRVELSTGKRGNPKGDRRGSDYGGRSRPYFPGPPRSHLPPPPDYDRFDPYFCYPYLDRDPYYGAHPADRYLPPRLPPAGDRYATLPRECLMPEEHGVYGLPPDPHERFLSREHLPPYVEERTSYEHLRPVEREPMPADPYYRERSPSSRPPPEYYERKGPVMRNLSTVADAAESRLNTTAYPPANGYDYYRRPVTSADQSGYEETAGRQDYYAAPARGSAGYSHPIGQQQPVSSGGGYRAPQQNKPYDSQAVLQTQPIFF